MRSLGVVLALLCLACGNSPTDPGLPTPGGSGTVTLSFNAPRQVSDDLRITFVQVVEDSRCPASVVCAWQGNGAVRLDITTRRGFQPVKLNTVGSADMPREATALGYVFTLEKLDPERATPDPVPPNQYKVTIRIRASPGALP